jgi:very-short-patch-repair endonuclease
LSHPRASLVAVDADLTIARLAATQHGVAARQQLLAAGVPRRAIEHRLAAGRLLRIHAGVYSLAGTQLSPLQHLMAAALAAGTGAVVSHRGAAFLHGLPGIEPQADVSVEAARAPKIRGVAVHRVTRLGRPDTGAVGGIPCTRPARTLLDLAGVLPPATLEVALDDALSRRLVSCAYLWRRIEALGRQGRAGAGVLNDLLADRTSDRPRSQSTFERRLFALLRAAGLPLPCTQHEVRLDGGRRAFLDFAYPDVLFAIEADSYRHHSSRTDWSRDRTRNNLLIAAGWRILPVTWDDLVLRPTELVALVARGLKENPRYVGEIVQTSRRATMAAG